MSLNRWLQERGELRPQATWAGTPITDSTSRFFVYKVPCQRHVLFRSKKAIWGNPKSALCARCLGLSATVAKAGACKPVGVDEGRLWHLLDSAFPELAWSMQDAVSGCGWMGKVDAGVYSPDFRRYMLVQVDGMTHSTRGMMGHSVEKQQLRDTSFAGKATGMGHVVVRLSTRHDDAAWKAALAFAVTACKAAAVPQWIVQSSMCGQPTVQQM